MSIPAHFTDQKRINMKIKIPATATVLCLIWLLISCGKKPKTPEDNTTFSIEVLETSVPVTSAEVCGTMYDNVLQLVSGTPLALSIKFSGSNNLAQYKIDIHNNFDCHAHERPMSEWHFLKIGEITGKTATITETIPLPADAFSGNYHCIIRLIDELGNEGPFKEFNLVVRNSEDSEAPVISYELPASDSIAINKGTQLIFKGTVTDNLSLENGRLEITYTDANGNDYNAINELFPAITTTSHHFERAYTIPAYAASGLAIFRLKAYDKFNNQNQKLIKVYILE